MPDVKCKICKRIFHVKPSHQKLGYGKYCSMKCRNESQRKGKYVYCDTCSKKIWKSPKEIKRSKSKLYFCSKSCQTKWRNVYFSGENHANWKHGENVYRKRLIESGKIAKCESCGIKDLRVLTAHHIDRDRANNNLENLKWLCLNCHHIEHLKK